MYNFTSVLKLYINDIIPKTLLTNLNFLRKPNQKFYYIFQLFEKFIACYKSVN